MIKAEKVLSEMNVSLYFLMFSDSLGRKMYLDVVSDDRE